MALSWISWQHRMALSWALHAYPGHDSGICTWALVVDTARHPKMPTLQRPRLRAYQHRKFQGPLPVRPKPRYCGLGGFQFHRFDLHLPDSPARHRLVRRRRTTPTRLFRSPWLVPVILTLAEKQALDAHCVLEFSFSVASVNPSAGPGV